MLKFYITSYHKLQGSKLEEFDEFSNNRLIMDVASALHSQQSIQNEEIQNTLLSVVINETKIFQKWYANYNLDIDNVIVVCFKLYHTNSYIKFFKIMHEIKKKFINLV